jgi:hypothetical protein
MGLEAFRLPCLQCTPLRQTWGAGFGSRSSRITLKGERLRRNRADAARLGLRGAASGEGRDPEDAGKTLIPATNQEIVLNGVDYGHVTVLLTAAFQEYIKQQQAKLASLQDEVEALKAAQSNGIARRRKRGWDLCLLEPRTNP